MKTTVEISDGLFEQVEQFADLHKLTLDEVVEAGLRKAIEYVPSEPFHLRDASFGGEGMVRDYT
jgi:hypothetical protein